MYWAGGEEEEEEEEDGPQQTGLAPELQSRPGEISRTEMSFSGGEERSSVWYSGWLVVLVTSTLNWLLSSTSRLYSSTTTLRPELRPATQSAEVRTCLLVMMTPLHWWRSSSSLIETSQGTSPGRTGLQHVLQSG